MSAQVTITQLPTAGTITGTEAVPIVQNGVTKQTTAAALAGSPIQTQTFITLNQEPTLANSRYLGATNGLTLSASSPQGVLNITTTGALSSLVSSGTGLQVKTDSTTLTGCTITTGTAGISVANGNGVSGNPTVSLTGQVLNFANATINGIVTLTTGGTVSSTQIQGTTNQISVSNGDGIAGSPTVGIASNPTLPGTAGVALPSGTTAQRAAASNGTLRYNSDTALLEAYLNGVWTSLASGTGVTSVATGTGLTGGPITSTGTISIANTAVTAGSYTLANITVNSQGQITAAANGTAGGVTSLSGGTTGLTPATATAGAVTLSGTLNVANGGTGQITAGAAFNALSPITSTGDLIVGNGTNSATRLGIGTNGYVLTVSSGTAVWAAASGGVSTFSGGTTGLTPSSATAGAITLAGTLAVANGGTGVTTSSGANSVVLRDASNNITANAFFNGSTSVAASGTLITLTVSSTPVYLVNGSGGQVIQLPNATTLPLGTIFSFNNNQSSGAITVNNNSTTLVVSVPSGAYVTVVLTANGTAAGAWDRHDQTPSNTSWSTNTLDYPGSITSATWNGGTIAISRGGTNSTATPTAGGSAYGTGTAYAFTAAGTAGQVLFSNGSSAPTWSGVSGGTF